MGVMGYLEGVTNTDEEGRVIRGNREPRAITEGNLKAGGVIGSENRYDLRIRVLSEPNQIPPTTQCFHLRTRRIVVHPKARVTLLVFK